MTKEERKLYSRKWRKEHPERAKELHRASYYRHRKERRMAYRKYYLSHLKETKRKNKKQHDANRQWLYSLKDKPCMDCKQQFWPWQMEFDHRPNEQKRFTIAHRMGNSRDLLLKEIEKCDIVCANCHRDRTYRRKHNESENSGNN